MRADWSDNAIAELATIQDYISESNPQNAERFLHRLIETVTELLIVFPLAGRAIPEMDDPTFREVIFGNYRVMYDVETDVVTVHSVRNSKMKFRPTGFDL
jgi:plasmid stabilization system protein ParE